LIILDYTIFKNTLIITITLAICSPFKTNKYERHRAIDGPQSVNDINDKNTTSVT